MGVTVSSEEIMRWPPGSHASTFGGNNAACAAGLAVLELMEEPGFPEHVTAMGEYLVSKLRWLQERHEIIGDVRGIGLMDAIELVKDPESREPAVAERNAVLRAAFEGGLTLLPAGESVIRFCPPLILQKEDVDAGIGILDQALGESRVAE